MATRAPRRAWSIGTRPVHSSPSTFASHHVLLKEVSLPNQRFMMRTDMSGKNRFEAYNVVLDDWVMHWATYDSLVVQGQVPVGVTIRNLSRGPQ